MAYSVVLQPFSGSPVSVEVARFLDRRDAEAFARQRCSGGEAPGLVAGGACSAAMFLREEASPADTVVVVVEEGFVEDGFRVTAEGSEMCLSAEEGADAEERVRLEDPYTVNLERPVFAETVPRVQALLRAWWGVNRDDEAAGQPTPRDVL